MASLPAKPQNSPSREAQSRFQDERDRRSRYSPHRVDDGTHSRRWVSGGDSYAPTYDTRREGEYYWRDTENRTRRSWNRQPDVDSRFGRGPPDYDRDREYERERRDYYAPNPRYRDSYGWRGLPGFMVLVYVVLNDRQTSHEGVLDPLGAGTEIGRGLPMDTKELDWEITLWILVPVVRRVDPADSLVLEVVMYPDDLGQGPLVRSLRFSQTRSKQRKV
ncbi:hypothetical protein C0993_003408 [Termitomyces sp. T159_Od127]|nr:hypothetical protein C0993_003408 [Termitomyces sp. T159_Od127]